MISLLIGCSDKKNNMSGFVPPDKTGTLIRVEFKEKISEREVIRSINVWDPPKNNFRFEDRGVGNPEFDQPLASLEYEHSVIGIEPPILPAGKIDYAKLKLKFEGPDDDSLLVTVDSVNFEKPQRRMNIVEREYDTLTFVTETILANGPLEVYIEAEDGHEFRLMESELKVVYYIREEFRE